MFFNSLLLVAGGGAIGAALRYSVSVALKPYTASNLWATLGVNLLGSLLIGILFGVLARSPLTNEPLKLALAVGVLGGFTTFSAFSFELLQLLERREVLAACLYAGGSVLGGLLLVLLGYWLTRGLSA